MKKKIDLVISSCIECPYHEYDPYYDCNYDSGFICEHEDYKDSFLVTDGQLRKYDYEMKEWLRTQDTLFPMSEDEKPKHPYLPFPEKCPLRNVDDEKA